MDFFRVLPLLLLGTALSGFDHFENVAHGTRWRIRNVRQFIFVAGNSTRLGFQRIFN